eukprot:gene24899-31293_t
MYKWKFFGVDIDPYSVEWATKNTKTSQDLSDNIRIAVVSDSEATQRRISELYLT